MTQTDLTQLVAIIDDALRYAPSAACERAGTALKVLESRVAPDPRPLAMQQRLVREGVMTPEELPAGRERDVLVAETVMGWEQCKIPEHGDDCSYWWETEGLRHGHTLPSFSTDIAAAWEVVEKLRTTWGDNSVIVQWAHETRQWVCCDHDAMTWEGAGDTAPLAICRAALAAVRAAAKEA